MFRCCYCLEQVAGEDAVAGYGYRHVDTFLWRHPDWVEGKWLDTRFQSSCLTLWPAGIPHGIFCPQAYSAVPSNQMLLYTSSE